MILWAEALLRTKGKSWACLDCSGKNPRLCAYYESLGYVPIGEEETYPGYVERMMQKWLLSPFFSIGDKRPASVAAHRAKIKVTVGISGNGTTTVKLKCPACGAPISAHRINVQQMIAVCPHCDNVFRFDSAFAPQRRKIKAPAQFRVTDDDPDRLDMAFKWSFRTKPPFGLVAILFGLSITLLMLRSA